MTKQIEICANCRRHGCVTGVWPCRDPGKTWHVDQSYLEYLEDDGLNHEPWQAWYYNGDEDDKQVS